MFEEAEQIMAELMQVGAGADKALLDAFMELKANTCNDKDCAFPKAHQALDDHAVCMEYRGILRDRMHKLLDAGLTVKCSG